MGHLDLTPIAAASMISVGDDVTFDELYRSAYAPMVRMAFALVGTQQHAGEVVQDAFAAVYERFDRIDNPEAYPRTTVLNGCRRVLRRRMLGRQPIPPTVDDELGASHVPDAIRRLRHRRLADRVRRSGRRHRSRPRSGRDRDDRRQGSRGGDPHSRHICRHDRARR